MTCGEKEKGEEEELEEDMNLFQHLFNYEVELMTQNHNGWQIMVKLLFSFISAFTVSSSITSHHHIGLKDANNIKMKSLPMFELI